MGILLKNYLIDLNAMKEPLSTTITTEGGEMQTCILREKINNGNGQLVYRYRNEVTGEEYMLAKDGGEWRTLNGAQLPECILKPLCTFGDQVQ